MPVVFNTNIWAAYGILVVLMLIILTVRKISYGRKLLYNRMVSLKPNERVDIKYRSGGVFSKSVTFIAPPSIETTHAYYVEHCYYNGRIRMEIRILDIKANAVTYYIDIQDVRYCKFSSNDIQ